MRFVVNQTLIERADLAPDTTLLSLLRRDRQWVGTKEGCASGDCGACTVLVGSARAGRWHYRAINACICPVGSLHNQRVITVEGLAPPGLGRGAALHPVQQALVDCHGSQCGFCTPGFVMSLVGLHLESQAIAEGHERAAVIEAISGNLCRCTGYRPIIEAGIQSLKKPAQMANIVQEWLPDAPLTGSGPAYRLLGKDAAEGYWQPTTEAGLQQLLTDYPQARLVAGGTDVMLEVTQLYQSLPQVIDLNAIPGLRQWQLTEDSLCIGAATPYSELEQGLARVAPEFVALLKRLGSRQIRNRGTLGGNICNASPIGDTPPWLLVLDAELELVNSRGETRREYLRDFYLGYKQTTRAPDEYLARIHIARQALAQPQRLFKVSKRYEDDISAVMGAFWWDAGHIRIAYGGMAGVPKRAFLVEAVLNTEPWHRLGQVQESRLALACDQLRAEFSPLSDVRASAGYRLAMACELLRKACYEFAAEAAGQAPERLFIHA
ncbi:xanthine dehydrogenase small subunit [Cellvibrio japonicus]|uniref:Xanthine dehydrogenase, XdhA subunit n=1 Tax=Cellvibrio japonicus (strain Ueda107) TaxID=498211 RepID=B3PJ35_CELJU|nr:xanthine dehydrogenase small subunit [Cellvibrio japonicus]ACE85969.1 xanthine dehydrogenase, XdhA subunit [Cellvibrio japonicus Ueda107]